MPREVIDGVPRRRPLGLNGLRGMKEADMDAIAGWIDEVIAHVDDETVAARVCGEVREFCRNFPAPGLPVD